MSRVNRLMSILGVSLLIATSAAQEKSGQLLVGAAKVDVTPEKFPVLVNGGMLSRQASKVVTRLYARAIVIKQGEEQVALVVVDSCMMPRDLLDSAKQLASKKTGIRPDRMLISATHAHSVPASMGCLGTDADPVYTPFLRLKLADVIAAAAEKLEPAQVGANRIDASKYTAVRRWVRRPDKMLLDPFGNRTVRANMHPGYRSPEATGPSGPTDPDLSLMVFRRVEDKSTIAVYANFCMHYYGGPTLGSDYFGLFADALETHVSGSKSSAVVMMSHGTSGDIWLRDYLQEAPKEKPHTLETYTAGLVELAKKAYADVRFQTKAKLAMAEAKLPLKYRTPSVQRLEWARKIVAGLKDGKPTNQQEVYAREAILLHEKKETELILQAVRIGEIGITAIPNEVYALTGLKLKALSPLPFTINVDLANGGEGYIPPPEQHYLGGYNTWPARSAGLEVQAEPRIVETVVQLLEKTAGKPRRRVASTVGKASRAIFELRPTYYWRLDEFDGNIAHDAMRRRHGVYELGVAFYLPGVHSRNFRNREVNRAPHFAGGRIGTVLDDVDDSYSVSLWCWNGMPNDARGVNGIIFSRGRDYGSTGEEIGIAGTEGKAGTLFFRAGEKSLEGKTVLERWTWYHIVLIRRPSLVQLYLNGKLEAELHGAFPPALNQAFIGGSFTRKNSFEGRLDEVAIFNRVLNVAIVRELYAAGARK